MAHISWILSPFQNLQSRNSHLYIHTHLSLSHPEEYRLQGRGRDLETHALYRPAATLAPRYFGRPCGAG